MPDNIGDVYLNYQDMMRKTNNLNTPLEVIGRELDSVNEFITDLPLVRASNIDYDEGAFIEPWNVNVLPLRSVRFFDESYEKRKKCLQSSVKCGVSIIRNIALKERSTVQ